MNIFNESHLYCKEITCKKLNISLSKLNRMLAANMIPFIKLGHTVKISGERLNQYLEKNTVE